MHAGGVENPYGGIATNTGTVNRTAPGQFSNSGTATGPNGRQVQHSGDTSCAGGTCDHTGALNGSDGHSATTSGSVTRNAPGQYSSSGTVTGANGNTTSHTASTDCAGSTCNRSGTVTGSDGGTVNHSGSATRVAPGVVTTGGGDGRARRHGDYGHGYDCRRDGCRGQRTGCRRALRRSWWRRLRLSSRPYRWLLRLRLWSSRLRPLMCPAAGRLRAAACTEDCLRRAAAPKVVYVAPPPPKVVYVAPPPAACRIHRAAGPHAVCRAASCVCRARAASRGAGSGPLGRALLGAGALGVTANVRSMNQPCRPRASAKTRSR